MVKEVIEETQKMFKSLLMKFYLNTLGPDCPYTVHFISFSFFSLPRGRGGEGVLPPELELVTAALLLPGTSDEDKDLGGFKNPLKKNNFLSTGSIHNAP